MAKGLEDTAFYRYCRFVALNEVGGSPEQFGAPVSAFHKANAMRVRRWPYAMLSTSTHDTKRGEDTRARLAALSGLPEEWGRHVDTWSRILRARRGDVDDTAPPYRNDEYLFYQLLAGTWPPELTAADTLDAGALGDYTARLKGAMIKSVREAKRHSTWEAPDIAYEGAVSSFVEDALDPVRSTAFLQSFLPFEERLARLGGRNSLVQTTLKLTAPGVPDIYQGADLWDFSLMDPDNRRPVDYELRDRLLDQVQSVPPCARRQAMRNWLEHWQDGAIKLALHSILLGFRRDHPDLFTVGTYEPLRAEGARADQVCAFLRRNGTVATVVAAALFPARLEAGASWGDTAIPLPDDLPRKCWQDLLTGAVSGAQPKGLAAEEVFRDLPAAVLVPVSPAPDPLGRLGDALQE
jgi:(1->4)-alpha-D-glucan 1-alpha-D-glucosylmutase